MRQGKEFEKLERPIYYHCISYDSKTYKFIHKVKVYTLHHDFYNPDRAFFDLFMEDHYGQSGIRKRTFEFNKFQHNSNRYYIWFDDEPTEDQIKNFKMKILEDLNKQASEAYAKYNFYDSLRVNLYYGQLGADMNNG